MHRVRAQYKGVDNIKTSLNSLVGTGSNRHVHGLEDLRVGINSGRSPREKLRK